ncbi:MAG: GYF domain-containing protein [Polyangiaceae bacterium]|nr:GYF domain-containing protein [Polyangiaceae bacterium]
MKFLCSNCKAKYQIADEKVVGRAVRIKCRKCGEIIDVAQNIAPPSLVPGPLDAEPPSSTEVAPPNAPIIAAPKPAPANPVVRAPSTTVGGAPGVPSPTVGAVPGVRPVPAPAKRPPAPSAPRGTAPPPRRTDGPTLSNPTVAADLAEPVRLQPPVSVSVPAERTPAAAVFGGGLAGAFSAAVATPAPVAVTEVAPPQSADEWFVGVNGSPIGPIKLSELRAKAMAGVVGLESLVWKDGFEEWKPLGSFPELAAVIEEGLSSIQAAPAALVIAAAAAARPEVVMADPFSSSATDSDTSRAVTTASTSDWPAPKQKSNVGWVAFLGLLAGGVGLTLGFVFFSDDTKEIVYIEKPGAAAQAATVAQNPGAGQAPGTEDADHPGEQPGQPRSKRPSKANGTSAPSAATTELPAKPAETLKGLGGLKLGGPALGGPAGTRPPTSGGPPLDASSVQAVVAKYSGSVKRACWQPALDSRDRNAPPSASVSVQITVGTTGSVQGVTTSGDPPGYRGLASCIQQRVRGWQFPPTSESTTVNVPFKFFSQ